MDADSDEERLEGDYDADCEYDEQWDPADDRAYWRRRFLILCGGVVALGVCAWMFPGARQPSASEAAATKASVAALARRDALPASATGAAWPGGTLPNAYPTAPPLPAAPAKKPAPKKPAPKKAQPRKAQAKKPGTAYHPGLAGSPASRTGACAPADIVLSLFTGQPSYARGSRPSFSVYAVSTAGPACTLTYGAGSVQVVVTRHGQVVWDSAACEPAPAPPVRFTRGVPQELTMVWNPAARSPAGCAGAPPARAGEALDAVAMSHGQSSPVRTFQFGG